MDGPVTLTLDANVALIGIDNPPVNALGLAVREGLLDALTRAEADPSVAAIVIIGRGRTFPAGADIREFAAPPVDPSLPDVVDRVEACAKPVIAALSGTVLGGGCELALGSHYRIAVAGTLVGLPEVLLGILPGAGGTQRLPRVIGAGPALDMMLTGKPVTVERARAMGLVDRIVGGDLEAEAIEFAREMIGKGPRRTGNRGQGLADREAYIAALEQVRGELKTSARGLCSPFHIVDCVEKALSTDLAEGLAFERTRFLDCKATPQSKALIHAFFAERAAAKAPGAGRAQPRALQTLGVVGGGTMGAGIAIAGLDAGLEVLMVERDARSIARGRASVEKLCDRQIAKGRMTEDQKRGVLGRFATSTEIADLGRADLVIEAVFEDLEVKKAVFAQLDAVAKSGAILATNTSYLNVDLIAAATKRPQDVLGLHFFSPANVMKLLEIVVTDQVADDVVATGFALAKRLGKIPVRAGNADGFIGNRIFAKTRNVVAHMVEDGASPYAIDRAIFDFGYPMGPHAVFDLAGLDIGWANRKKDAPTRPPGERYVEIADRICERGWFGRKTGRGFYRYDTGNSRGAEDPDVLAIIEAERAHKGITARTFSDAEIVTRFTAAMVNEACEVLREGVALKPSDIDIVLMHGYGYPRYRGGPMHYADALGLDRILADIRSFEAEDRVFWRPSLLLVDLVESGGSLGDLNRRAAARARTDAGSGRPETM